MNSVIVFHDFKINITFSNIIRVDQLVFLSNILITPKVPNLDSHKSVKKTNNRNMFYIILPI